MMRISVNFTEEVLAKADAMSKGMGVSRSAYLSMLVSKDAKESEIVGILPAMLDAYKIEEQKAREIAGNSGN